jgi:predicted CXXCH cytochrome family protein
MIAKRQKRLRAGPLKGSRYRSFISVRRRAAIILGIVSIAATIFSFNFLRRALAQETSSCVVCHSGLESRLSDPVKLFDHDIHKSKGLSCSDCHGGNPAKSDKAGAKDSAWGYVGKPTAQQMPAFCGKCHSDAALMKKFNPSLRVDQVQEYYTSVHGSRLKGGDQNVATCVSCHGVHGIRSPGDPQSSVYALNVAETCAKCHANAEHMAEYGIAHDQFDKYRSSVHAKALYEKHDLSAPTCNDCHGNHGAVPPGLTSVANVCGQCHARQAELFQKSPHKTPFDRMQSGECLRCHSNHGILPPTDLMAGVGEGSVCTSCHNNDAGFAAAQRIGKGLGEVNSKIEDAKDILDRAERAGMEVSRPKFELRDASDGLTQARVLVHSASADELEKALGPAMEVAAKSYAAGESAFDELSYRRKGLGVSLVFILFLALLVYLKIRQIESGPPAVEI